MKLKALLLVGAVISVSWATAAPTQNGLKPMKQKGQADEAFGGKCIPGACFTFKAEARGRPIRDGRFVGEFDVYTSRDFENPRGLDCNPAVGEGVFKRNNNHKIRVVFTGSSCDLGKFDVTRLEAYGRIVGGTGDYQGAKGRGGLQLIYDLDKNALPMNYQWDGTIKT
jgi:hypothetical protein